MYLSFDIGIKNLGLSLMKIDLNNKLLIDCDLLDIHEKDLIKMCKNLYQKLDEIIKKYDTLITTVY